MKAEQNQNDPKIKKTQEVKKTDSEATNYIIKVPRKDRKENLIVKVPPRPFTKD